MGQGKFITWDTRKGSEIVYYTKFLDLPFRVSCACNRIKSKYKGENE